MTDVQRLAEKLRPLIPREVDRWMRLRESGDPELIRLVDEQVRASARRLLAGQSHHSLLAIPPEGMLAGPISLGTVLYAGERGDAAVTLSDILSNVAIFGRSGAGKTNSVFALITQLEAQGVHWLFLDWKRTARHLIPQLGARPNVYTPGRSLAPMQFNPFTPPPALEPKTYVAHVVDAVAEAYDLGDGAISVLQQALMHLYSAGNLSPTPQQLVDHIGSAAIKGRAIGWTASAVRALRSMDLASIGGQPGVSPAELVKSFFEQNTIVELDGLSAAARRFLVPMLCHWIYSQRLAARDRERLELVIVVEEAHHVMRRERHGGHESALSILLRQCREIGIGMVVVDQHPHLISSSALGNTAVTLVLNLKDPADISKAAALCGLEDQDRSCITHLPVGHAVVKLQNRFRKAFLVRMSQIVVEKGAVTDQVLGDWLARSPATQIEHPARSARSGPDDADSGGFGHVRSAARALSEDALRLLEDVLAHAGNGILQRYRRVGLSGERGHRAKLELIRTGWIEQQVVQVGTTRRTLVRGTPKSRSLVEAAPAVGEGSIAHEYWRARCIERLTAQGYAVQSEAMREGGRIDVLARRDDGALAVEIETGKSDAVGNVRGCLRAGIERVMVVATNRAAMEKVERQLAAEGLLIPSRVALVLQDAWPTDLAWAGQSAPAAKEHGCESGQSLEDAEIA